MSPGPKPTSALSSGRTVGLSLGCNRWVGAEVATPLGVADVETLPSCGSVGELVSNEDKIRGEPSDSEESYV